MEFTEYKCPVCGELFKSGDDIVVCPDCGAPHHRECYENQGECFFKDKHKEGFSFDESREKDDSHSEETDGFVICQNCKTENEKTAFYCSKCGFPLNPTDRRESFNRQNARQGSDFGNRQGTPFGYGAAGAPMFDPLAGLNSEDEIADNVKVGEAAKYIGKNTPYYLSVFSRIKQYGSSKFNFSAFLLSGGYFIYRKMYGIGITLCLAMIALSVASSYIMMSGDWIANYNSVLEAIKSGNATSVMNQNIIALYLPVILSALRFVIMIASGLTANRTYYKHCQKKITEIKSNETEDVNKELETRGGVNLPMAISFLASVVVIYEICNVLVNTSTLMG